MPVSVTVSGTPARAWRRNISETLPALARTLTKRTAARRAPARRAAYAVSCSMKRLCGRRSSRRARPCPWRRPRRSRRPPSRRRAARSSCRAGWCRRTPRGSPRPSPRACRRRGGRRRRGARGRTRCRGARPRGCRRARADALEAIGRALAAVARQRRLVAVQQRDPLRAGSRTSSVASARAIDPPPPVISTRRPPNSS